MYIQILHPRRLICQSLGNHLSTLGYQAQCCGSTIADAVAIARQTPPNMALIDLDFDGGSGFEAARLLLLAHTKTRVIMCLPPDPAYLQLAVQTDASGYLPTDFELPELETCLQRVQDRFRYLSPAFATQLRLPIPVVDELVVEKIRNLTEREKKVLRLICRGMMQKEIAQKLGIVESTVVSFKKTIADKLGLVSRREIPFFMAPYLAFLD